MKLWFRAWLPSINWCKKTVHDPTNCILLQGNFNNVRRDFLSMIQDNSNHLEDYQHLGELWSSNPYPWLNQKLWSLSRISCTAQNFWPFSGGLFVLSKEPNLLRGSTMSQPFLHLNSIEWNPKNNAAKTRLNYLQNWVTRLPLFFSIQNHDRFQAKDGWMQELKG